MSLTTAATTSTKYALQVNAILHATVTSPSLSSFFLIQDLEDAPFYSDSDESKDEDEEEEEENKKKKPKKKPYMMDSDHRMLLRNSKPLLQSRNTSVSHMTARGQCVCESHDSTWAVCV